MMRLCRLVILYGSLPLLGSACASKDFVQKQMEATESRLTERMNATETRLTTRTDVQERELRETANRVGLSRRALDEVGTLAVDAKARAESVDVSARDAEARLAQRLATRNNYRVLETRAIYFDSGQAEIRREALSELEDVANALKADVNAIVELQSFADPRGSDRYNNVLARDRVEAVMRYLVQRGGIELRQLHAVAMGKEESASGERLSAERLAKSRRVEMRLLAPWSSPEDKQAQVGRPSDEGGAASPPTSIERDRVATPRIGPREGPKQDARWREIMQSISPQELGGRD